MLWLTAMCRRHGEPDEGETRKADAARAGVARACPTGRSRQGAVDSVLRSERPERSERVQPAQPTGGASGRGTVKASFTSARDGASNNRSAGLLRVSDISAVLGGCNTGGNHAYRAAVGSQ